MSKKTFKNFGYRVNKANWNQPRTRSVEYHHEFGLFIDPEAPQTTPRKLNAGIHFRGLDLMDSQHRLVYLKNYYSVGKQLRLVKNWNSLSIESQIKYMRKRFSAQYQESLLERRLIWVRKNVPKFWYNNKAFSIYAFIVWIITDWFLT